MRFGLAELVVYVQLATEAADIKLTTVVDESVDEKISWQTDSGTVRQATLPRIIFLREQSKT